MVAAFPSSYQASLMLAGVYVPPFDHEDIWEGNSHIVDELQEQLRGAVPDVFICSVGGGGLFNGVMLGLDRAGWSSHVTVLAVETEGAESLHKSIEAKQLVTLPAITSMATSLGAVTVAAKTLENGLRPNVRSVVLPDAEAAMGCWRLADDERLLVEAACGVNVALCYDGRLEKALGRKVTPETIVVVEVCGGCNITIEMLAAMRKEFAWVEKMMPHDSKVPSSVAAP
jgi:L-serine/L-threonine ammonia-lyase